MIRTFGQRPPTYVASTRTPENAVVWSVDEKSGMQAKSRRQSDEPAIPGTRTRREFEYKRHGTVVLFAALSVHEGTPAGWVTDSSKSDNFVAFLGDLVPKPDRISTCTASPTILRRTRLSRSPRS